jgi:hydroxymethylpyrimidine/phosphomethylpyrimidine kinase
VIPRILIIAGSDSGGGAGIQADLKTVAMLGGHGMTAITAITAQNTLGVTAVEMVSPEMVLAQIDAVVSDIGVDAIKIGMIGSAATANAVAGRLESLSGVPIVFDPVMVATSGSVLADAETIAAFDRLMRIARLVTPNLPELAALGGDPSALAQRTGAAFLVKGGHGDGATIVDQLIDPDGGECEWRDSRIDTHHSHGTGCTLASAIATGLGAGMPLGNAITRARRYVRQALLNAPGFGAGHGPMGFLPEK